MLQTKVSHSTQDNSMGPLTLQPRTRPNVPLGCIHTYDLVQTWIRNLTSLSPQKSHLCASLPDQSSILQAADDLHWNANCTPPNPGTERSTAHIHPEAEKCKCSIPQPALKCWPMFDHNCTVLRQWKQRERGAKGVLKCLIYINTSSQTNESKNCTPSLDNEKERERERQKVCCSTWFTSTHQVRPLTPKTVFHSYTMKQREREAKGVLQYMIYINTSSQATNSQNCTPFLDNETERRRQKYAVVPGLHDFTDPMLCVVVTVATGSTTSRTTTRGTLHLPVVGIATPTACNWTLIVALSVCAVLLKMKHFITMTHVMLKNMTEKLH